MRRTTEQQRRKTVTKEKLGVNHFVYITAKLTLKATEGEGVAVRPNDRPLVTMSFAKQLSEMNFIQRFNVSVYLRLNKLIVNRSTARSERDDQLRVHTFRKESERAFSAG